MAAAKLLNNAIVTGAGAGYKLPEARSMHAIQIKITDANASVTAVSVKLQGTLAANGVADASADWFDMGLKEFDAGEITALYADLQVKDVLARRVRANLTVYTGSDGSADKCTVLYNPGVI